LKRLPRRSVAPRNDKTKKTMKIDLTIESVDDCGFTPSNLESIANNILDKLDLKKPHSIIEVFLVTDDEIKVLNKKHRDKNEATDVLSFPQEQFPVGDEQTLGTIFIAPEFAKNEGVECKELFAHGILHLLGYDHETNKKKWEDAEAKTGIKTL